METALVNIGGFHKTCKSKIFFQIFIKALIEMDCVFMVLVQYGVRGNRSWFKSLNEGGIKTAIRVLVRLYRKHIVM